MKKYLLLILATAFSLEISAQTQQGVVKTKGRLVSNGTIIAGTRLPGATITIRGGNAVVSGKKGTFSLAIPGNNYYLQNVQKQGYVLTDPDVLSKQYAYSENPLVLVLETPDQQADDKIAVEKNIRRTLQKQLQEKEDELDALKEQQKINKEEYRRKLQEVLSKQKNNETLIGDMVDRYSKIDFDEVDEFNRRLSQLIFDGKLIEADSLINAKGDMNLRVADYRQLHEANTQTEKNLKKGKELEMKKRADIAQDCYSKFQIKKMQLLNDSAGYYLEIRANLDTMNVEWLLEVANFAAEYDVDYDKAEQYAIKALHASIEQYGDDSEMVAYCLNDLGNVYSGMGHFDKAISMCIKSAKIRQKCFGEKSEELALCYSNIGKLYKDKDILDSAHVYYDKALQIRQAISDIESSKIAESYIDLGQLENSTGNPNKALQYYHKALPLVQQEEYDKTMLELCNALGTAYTKVDSLDIALGWYNRALEISKKIFGESHPSVAVILSNIGHFYSSINHHVEALDYEKQALEIRTKTLGLHHPELGFNYNNIAVTLYNLDKIDEALEYMKKSLNLNMIFYGENSSPVANDYLNIAAVMGEKRQFDKALELDDKALSIITNIYGSQSEKAARLLGNIADVYYKKKDYEKAIMYNSQAIDIYKQIYGENHSSLIKVYNNLSLVYSDSGDLQKGIATIQQVLNISRAIYGEENGATATSYSNLGIAYFKNGEYDKAINCNQKSQEIKTKLYGSNSYEVALENLMLGRICEEKKDYSTAIKAYTNYLGVARSYQGEDSREVVAHNAIIYNCFQSLLSAHPTQQNIEWFKQFISDKSFVMIPAEGGLAFQKGLKGEYPILRFFDWNINDITANFFEVNSKVKSLPKSIVVMGHGGKVESYEFGEPTMGVQFVLKNIDPEKKQILTRAWQEWNQKDNK